VLLIVLNNGDQAGPESSQGADAVPILECSRPNITLENGTCYECPKNTRPSAKFTECISDTDVCNKFEIIKEDDGTCSKCPVYSYPTENQ